MDSISTKPTRQYQGFPPDTKYRLGSLSPLSAPQIWKKETREITMEEEIRTEFKRSGFAIENQEVLNKCLTFCINYALSPSDLVSSWEAYYLSRQLNGPTVQDAEMDGFLLHLQSEQRDAIIKEEPYLHLYSSHDVDMILSDGQEDLREGMLSSPTNRPCTLDQDLYDSSRTALSSGKPSDLLTPFEQRTSKFVVQFTINNQQSKNSTTSNDASDQSEDDIIRKVQPIKRCSLVIHGSNPKPACKFMYDRIEDKFNYLETRINKLGSAFIASSSHEKAVDPSVASQNSIFAVGMIYCDGEGRLNEKSALLQSSVEHSGGQRVRLDLEKLNHYSVFPGQVVGIVGNNPSGHCLVASEVVECVPFSNNIVKDPNPAKKMSLAEKSIPNEEPNMTSEVSLIIAAGPFTTTDNLFFEPLTELLAYATRKQPHLLILLGPFVDSEHPEIKKGILDRTFDDIFQHEVMRRLQDHVEYMGSETRVLLVPSVRDTNHDFVFPQAPFDAVPSNLRDQIISLSNPGFFNANEVKVGCCTIDILKQLSGEEISRLPKGGPSGDRLSRLMSHLLNQHSFYPLYPPAEDVPLDFSLAPEALDIPSVPQILILPSDLSPFIKFVSVAGKEHDEVQKSCICVNPGRLSKGIGGGTFVELRYRGNCEDTQASIIRCYQLASSCMRNEDGRTKKTLFNGEGVQE
ncbi:hypothetical protein V2J09_019899 [Rumex salicifolius]